MSLRHKSTTNHNTDRHLLAQFPMQTLFRRFPRFNLAAGKLPLEGEGHRRAALGSEKKSVLFNQRAGNMMVTPNLYSHSMVAGGLLEMS